MIWKTSKPVTRDSVFIAGGQPTVTYVKRKQLDVERQLARAIAAPNQVASLAGPTKCGKTVLCRHILGQREYIWIEGGQVKTAKEIWERICSELNFPSEMTDTDTDQSTDSANVKVLLLSASGSQLQSRQVARKFSTDLLPAAVKYLLENNIALVVDDFHYLAEDERKDFVRNIKGAVFKGLKVVLISASHRVFDAIRAEKEMTGRFMSVTVPEWRADELSEIASTGFDALNMHCNESMIAALARECQNSPFLMQKFCWEICYDMGVDVRPKSKIGADGRVNLKEIFIRIARDSGLPIYQRLVAGPHIRKDRMPRPLANGGEADVYEAVLLAIAQTGPKAKISYGSLRTSLNEVLADKVPQRHEVTSVLKQLSKISREIGNDVGVDWDEEGRSLDISDPYLRFYLRWQVRKDQSDEPDLLPE